MFLQLANRSWNPLKVGILMANWVWVVDADYYNNSDNEGHIQWIFWNMTPEDIFIKKWQKIFQWVFVKYETTKSEENDFSERAWGFGSTWWH